jgi:hypothetical protein
MAEDFRRFAFGFVLDDLPWDRLKLRIFEAEFCNRRRFARQFARD